MNARIARKILRGEPARRRHGLGQVLRAVRVRNRCRRAAARRGVPGLYRFVRRWHGFWAAEVFLVRARLFGASVYRAHVRKGPT